MSHVTNLECGKDEMMDDDIGTYTDSESLGMNMDPVSQAELIRSAADIDPTTGRDPEHLYDPECDHCADESWTILLKFVGHAESDLAHGFTRRLCDDCARLVLEWV